MAKFIPKQYKKEPITVRFSPDKLEKLDEYAEVYQISRSEFVNQCIDFAFQHMPESPTDQEYGKQEQEYGHLQSKSEQNRK